MSDVPPIVSIGELLGKEKFSIKGSYECHQQSYIEALPTEVFEHIIKNLSVEDLKNIRLVNKLFSEKSAQFWKKIRKKFLKFHRIPVSRLTKVVNETETILGIDIHELQGEPIFYRVDDSNPDEENEIIRRNSVDDCLQSVVRKHPEVRQIKIGLSLCGNRGLAAILTLQNIETISVASKFIGVQDPPFNRLNWMQENSDEEDEEEEEELEEDQAAECPVQNLSLAGCNNLTDPGFESILSRIGQVGSFYNGHMKSLIINMSEVTLNNIPTIYLRNLRNLENLDLYGCRKLCQVGLASFLNIIAKTLKALNLSSTNLTLSDMCDSVKFSSLEKLYLDRCENLSEAGLATFLSRTGSRLKLLDLSATQLTLSGIASVSRLYLEELRLNNKCKNISENGIVNLLDKTSGTLKTLDLSWSNISLSEIVSSNLILPCLENLDLLGCKMLSAPGLFSFLNKAQATIKVLNLGKTNALSDVNLLSGYLPCLEKLKLNESDISDGVLVSFLEKSENLKTLDLEGTRVTLANIGSATFSSLQNLILKDCKCLSETGFSSLLNATGLSLTTLDCTGSNIALTEMGLVVTNLRLEELKLSQCENLSETGLMALLVKIADTCKVLRLNNIRISFAGIVSVSSMFPCLEILSLSGNDVDLDPHPHESFGF